MNVSIKILEMWKRVLTDNILPLHQLYDDLTEPIALLIGIPICIALCSIILTILGGKFK